MLRLLKRFRIHSFAIVILGASLLAFQNCSKASFSSSSNNASSGSGLTSQSIGLPTTVCDPLTGSTSSSSEQGIVGKVIYVPTAIQSRVSLAQYSDILANGVQGNSTVYLSQLDVPTRDWTEGLSTTGPNALLDNDGNKLLTYFALQMQTTLSLTSANAPGYYQLAIISDDGAMVSGTLNGVSTALAGSTGQWHSTLSECGTTATYMDNTTKIPLDITYYQGPPVQLGVVMLWRKVASPTQLSSPECGVDDENFFTQPSSGLSDYQTMLANGWSVVPSENLLLPAGAQSNPCATP